MLTLTIKKLHLPSGLTTPITAALYYKLYYASSWTLVQTGVPIGLDGTILSSPQPFFSIDPTQMYMIRAVNELCGFVYEQAVSVFPYCLPGYTLSEDGSYCYRTLTVSATPPSAPENSIAVNHNDYSVWASLIYDPGYNVNGTGPFTQISFGNPFWVNGAGFPTGAGANTSLGPLNRAGLWATSALSNQTIGFSVCITVPTTGVYYIGTGSDNFSTISVDSIVIVQMDPTAVAAYLSAHGYPGVGVESTFRFWHIYPVTLTAGTHVLNVIGTNISVVGSLGAEIYNNTSAEIQAATNYGALNLIFSSKDFIGMPIQIGSDNIGYSCPVGYALKACDSPITCVKTEITPVLF